MLPTRRSGVLDFPKPGELAPVDGLRSGPRYLEDARVVLEAPEGVAGPRHRRDARLLPDGQAQLVADAVDPALQRGRAAARVAPGELDQPPVRHHPARVCRENAEDPEFERSQADLPAVVADLLTQEIELQTTDPDGVIAAALAGLNGTTEDRRHPRPQDAGAERLGHVIVGAQAEGAHDVLLLVARSQHDDRHLAVQPDPMADLEPVKARQPEVQDD